MTDRMMTLRNNRIVSLVIQGVHYNDYNTIVIWGENSYILINYLVAYCTIIH